MSNKKSKTEHYLNTKLKHAWKDYEDNNEENLCNLLFELKTQISYLNIKVDYLMHALEDKEQSEESK